MAADIGVNTNRHGSQSASAHWWPDRHLALVGTTQGRSTSCGHLRILRREHPSDANGSYQLSVAHKWNTAVNRRDSGHCQQAGIDRSLRQRVFKYLGRPLEAYCRFRLGNGDRYAAKLRVIETFKQHQLRRAVDDRDDDSEPACDRLPFGRRDNGPSPRPASTVGHTGSRLD